MTLLLLTAIVFFLLFLLMYNRNKSSLIPSFLLTISLLTAIPLLAVVLYNSESTGAKWILIVLLILCAVIIAFGIYGIIAFLIFNTIAVLKREKHALAHCLTLVLAVGIIVFLVVTHIVNRLELPTAVSVFRMWVDGLVICYGIHVTQYLLAVLLCNLYRPRKNQDYIIVHGSGLIDGRVTPLLAGRVDRAVNFYHQQKLVGKPPHLVLSGGQGADEARSEAVAMAEYAVEKGISKEDILLEDQSKTTLENMQFSKMIMDKDAGGKPYKTIFSTSNYHLLRTGIYARKAGMNISGIGSRTAFYYLPNALLREYVAYIVLYWKANVVFVLFSFLAACALCVVLLLNS